MSPVTRYVLIQLFWVICLFIPGCIATIIALIAHAYTHDYNTDRTHWDWGWMWIFDNTRDGICPYTWKPTSRIWWRIFTWAAIRNSCNNMVLLPGFGGPALANKLFYRTYKIFGKQFYTKMGWLSDGYISFQPIGAGRGW